MDEPFLGEIRPFSFGFAPKGWASCDGQLLPIAQNAALFSLLGTMYGGDGRTTFALPDLRGRAAMHAGTGPGLPPATIGTASGEETHALTGPETANHSHVFNARINGSTGATQIPGPTVMLGSTTNSPGGLYTTPFATAIMGSTSTGGSGAPHENRMPYLPINYCICLEGPFPSPD